MEPIATTVEIWASLGTIVGTVAFLVVPTLVYAWYAIERLIDDENGYEPVIAAVERARRGAR
jgi:hypothetical protein